MVLQPASPPLSLLMMTIMVLAQVCGVTLGATHIVPHQTRDPVRWYRTGATGGPVVQRPPCQSHMPCYGPSSHHNPCCVDRRTLPPPKNFHHYECWLYGQCDTGCSPGRKMTGCLGGGTYRPKKQVKVSVIQTSACSDSRDFLTTYLYPMTHVLNDHLDIELIFYGKVNQSGHCQFGYGDCLGNTLLLCAGRHLPDQLNYLAFSVCFMANIRLLKSNDYTSIISSATQCAQRFPNKIEDLRTCTGGKEGYRLFQEAGRRQRQLAPRVTEVPTVALDEVVVITRTRDLAYFPRLLCQKLRGVPAARPYCQFAYRGGQQYYA
ncbi:gamma-interferon-inducible lysosomal thiol reductase-like [Panulirus ornatus]|uniref:gamma-interferon-inducible lysosomal thiol reductase-like n=1 Tax=Panulirus ornatus TaxID=150431 RepID=UPI003A84C4CB